VRRAVPRRAQICLGPVCVPVGALLPALVVLAHQRGWLLWINPRWFDYKFWWAKLRGCAPAARVAAARRGAWPWRGEGGLQAVAGLAGASWLRRGRGAARRTERRRARRGADGARAAAAAARRRGAAPAVEAAAAKKET
jgi:hypothetical protein